MKWEKGPDRFDKDVPFRVGKMAFPKNLYANC